MRPPNKDDERRSTSRKATPEATGPAASEPVVGPETGLWPAAEPGEARPPAGDAPWPASEPSGTGPSHGPGMAAAGASPAVSSADAEAAPVKPAGRKRARAASGRAVVDDTHTRAAAEGTPAEPARADPGPRGAGGAGADRAPAAEAGVSTDLWPPSYAASAMAEPVEEPEAAEPSRVIGGPPPRSGAATEPDQGRAATPGALAAAESPGRAAAEVHPTPPPAPARSGGRFWPALFGAVLGGAVGAGGVWYATERMPRQPDPELAATLDTQRGVIVAQSDRVTALEGEIGALREALQAAAPSGALDELRTEATGRLDSVDQAVTALAGRLDGVDGRVAEVGGRIGDLAGRLDRGDIRLAELEARPIADPETANQALRSEIADMRSEVERATEVARAQVETMRGDLTAAAAATQAQVAEAERRAAELEAQARERAAALQAEAETAARSAEGDAARARVAAAIDAGEPFGPALATFTASTGAAVPAALSGVAETGVATLGELREAFPEAAREALRVSRREPSQEAPGGRLLDFLRSQTQARSLSPQDGTTPDAILSRAEAALAAGDVAGALAELEALPAEGRAAMQGWIDDATERAAALDAVAGLTQGRN